MLLGRLTRFTAAALVLVLDLALAGLVLSTADALGAGCSDTTPLAAFGVGVSPCEFEVGRVRALCRLDRRRRFGHDLGAPAA